MNNSVRRALVLEDDEAVSLMLRFYLEEDGFEVHSADRCSGFLERVPAVQPDLICLDILLPDGDGFAICNQLRNDEATRQIPVICCTVCTDEADECAALGVTYITKPFLEADFKNAVKNIFPQST